MRRATLFLTMVAGLILSSVFVVGAQTPDVVVNQSKFAPGDRLEVVIEFKAPVVLDRALFSFVRQGEPQRVEQKGLTSQINGGRNPKKLSDTKFAIEDNVPPVCVPGLYRLVSLEVSAQGATRRYVIGTDFKKEITISIENPNYMQFPEIEDLTVGPAPDTNDGVPKAGTGGYTYPECLYCPTAQFSDEAVKAKYQGMVTLMAIITPDGKATDIHVVKGLGMGLDEKAIEAVRTWRFKPALGPDGKPAGVRQDVEVPFHLY